jgi:hypothetical protein
MIRVVTKYVSVCAIASAAFLTLSGTALAQLPDNFKTPGATTKANQAAICEAGFVRGVKPASSREQADALERYGIRPESFKGDLEHLVPVALGGSNDPDNLYPFHTNSNELTLEAKHQLADKLQAMVCSGKLSLKEAQAAFKKDWTKAYKQYATAMNAPGN